jgi:hypothetical protein
MPESAGYQSWCHTAIRDRRISTARKDIRKMNATLRKIIPATIATAAAIGSLAFALAFGAGVQTGGGLAEDPPPPVPPTTTTDGNGWGHG